MATMCSRLTTLWVAVVALALAVGVEAGRGKETKQARTNILLQEAVRQLLGIREGVNATPEAHSSKYPHSRELHPPKYILDLYEKYKYSDFDRGQLRGNTVRSIHANIGEVNGEAMFLFNMSSVRPTEKVLSAEIHLYKRKRRSRKTDIDVVLYEIAPHYLSEMGKVTMRNSAYGWQWYDVTDAVLSCLAARRVRPHLFALSFRGHRGDGKTREVALRKFARHHSMPYLILYSNETSDINLDQMDKLAVALKSQMSHDAQPQGAKDKEDNKTNPPPAVPSGEPSKEAAKAEVSEGGEEVERRARRSVFTNEIPEDPADYKRFDYRFNLPQTHPGMLQARRESRHELSDHRLIPYPSEKRRRRRRKHRRRNRKRNRKNRNRHLTFPDEWEDLQDNVAAPDNNLSELCGRRKLTVDFADIGWGEWIISPKSFEAHYCAGTCPFPLTKRLRPSNHATIQSIVNAIGLYEHVPPPCCVPDAMSSVTLLYFDEDRNVVLKNYPAMTVQACACR